MITDEELRLAENVTTAEWRDRYQPAGLRFRDYQGPDTRRAQPAAGAGAAGVAGTGEKACGNTLPEEEWKRLGMWMVYG